MRLSDFILGNVEPILADWEAYARSLAPGARMDKRALRDHAENILRATARDMSCAQTVTEQSEKSKGDRDACIEGDRLDEASGVHGVDRVGSGFDLVELVGEYRALRASVLRLWRESSPNHEAHDLDDLTRFNESIDQSLIKAVQSYTRRVDQSRRMFLAILGHDLRNPLNCIMMSAQLVSLTESSEELLQISTSAAVIAGLINDLIDFAGTGLGAQMPLSRVPVDLGELCREVVEEFQTSSPTRSLRLQTTDDVRGEWDPARLRQVISNLLGNAIQHGSHNCAVELAVKSDGTDVVLSVHNDGAPIPADLLPTIFDPLVRGPSISHHRRRPGSIGLGLYIAREVVNAHGGVIGVQSTEKSGTVFEVKIPRFHTVQRELTQSTSRA